MGGGNVCRDGSGRVVTIAGGCVWMRKVRGGNVSRGGSDRLAGCQMEGYGEDMCMWERSGLHVAQAAWPN